MTRPEQAIGLDKEDPQVLLQDLTLVEQALGGVEMADASVPNRELVDGSTQRFEEGRWVECPPPGSYETARLGAGSALFNAALTFADDPDRARRRIAEALRAADLVGQRAFALAYARRLLDKLEGKGAAPRRTIDAGRAALASLDQ